MHNARLLGQRYSQCVGRPRLRVPASVQLLPASGHDGIQRVLVVLSKAAMEALDVFKGALANSFLPPTPQIYDHDPRIEVRCVIRQAPADDAGQAVNRGNSWDKRVDARAYDCFVQAGILQLPEVPQNKGVRIEQNDSAVAGWFEVRVEEQPCIRQSRHSAPHRQTGYFSKHRRYPFPSCRIDRRARP